MTVKPDWKKGDALILKGIPTLRPIKFLAWSSLDSDCFIAEDEDGEIFDDWVIREFKLLHEEG